MENSIKRLMIRCHSLNGKRKNEIFLLQSLTDTARLGKVVAIEKIMFIG